MRAQIVNDALNIVTGCVWIGAQIVNDALNTVTGCEWIGAQIVNDALNIVTGCEWIGAQIINNVNAKLTEAYRWHMVSRNLVDIGSGYGLLLVWHLAITWTADQLHP